MRSSKLCFKFPLHYSKLFCSYRINVLCIKEGKQFIRKRMALSSYENDILQCRIISFQKQIACQYPTVYPSAPSVQNGATKRSRISGKRNLDFSEPEISASSRLVRRWRQRTFHHSIVARCSVLTA